MRASALGKWLLAGTILVLLLLAWREVRPLLPSLPARVAALGLWGPVAVAGLYALLAVALVPGLLLTLAAGVLFGVGVGSVVVFVGATTGAALSFLIARYLARDAVSRVAARYPRFAAVDRAIGADGLRIVLLLRMSPLFPFVLLNYGLGLTTVRFRDFVLGSVGMVPLIVLYVYLGQLAGEAALVAGGAPARGPLAYGVLAAGLLVTGVVTVRITRLARAALEERLPTPDAARAD
ncbi:MAG: TVP38/TMEM64 family protein [Gemmatimonadetes bacterium]|nr:TVP38/TMEM64 family protein [Gemmatimonadota bacterium]